MKTVYLALGSNLGDRLRNLQRAVTLLNAAGVTVQKVSSVWETEPVGFADQGWFLNIALKASTDLMPIQLLVRTASVEQAMGRKRAIRNGPRTIDIDILLFGRTILDTPTLTLPHPRLHERRFVLEPLNEIAPTLRHPILGQSIGNLLHLAPPLKLKMFSKWKEPAEASS